MNFFGGTINSPFAAATRGSVMISSGSISTVIFFAALRARNLDDLRALGLTPQLGHLHQVAKAMAFQYRDEVGPWRELLTILPGG